MLRSRRVDIEALILVAAVFLPALPAGACQVPVFRYALERWMPSLLDVVVFHRGPLTPAQQRLADALKSTSIEGGGPANFALRMVDASSEIAAVDDRLWETLRDAPLPQVTVRYNQPVPELAMVWGGPLTAESIRQIADSPARRQIAERIVQGDSMVWVLLEGGDRVRDDKLAATLSAGLATVRAELKLPEDSEKAALPSGPALRIGLSLLRLQANDPAERVFTAMLRHVDGEQPAAGEPVVVPIFGRGRALGVIREADLDEQMVRLASEFLCGKCSCQVKDECPGTDMLIAADWEAPFAGGRLSDALPALSGLAPFAAATQAAADTARRSVVPLLAEVDGHSSLWRNLGLAAAGLAAVGVGSTLLVLRRRKERA